jgi:hypothetical protein
VCDVLAVTSVPARLWLSVVDGVVEDRVVDDGEEGASATEPAPAEPAPALPAAGVVVVPPVLPSLDGH